MHNDYNKINANPPVIEFYLTVKKHEIYFFIPARLFLALDCEV